MERAEVYKALDSERDYQDVKWAFTKSGNRISATPTAIDRSIDEYALYIGRYGLQLINEAGGTRPDGSHASPEELLATIRKIGALCVAAGEKHGLPKRIF